MLSRLTLTLLLILGLSVLSDAQQKNDLVGSYLYRFEWGGEELTLKSNGSFISHSSNCTSVFTSAGPYTVTNNILSLTTTKMSVRSYDEKKGHDLTKRKVRKQILDTDEPFKSDTEELQIVRWGERIYLMHLRQFGGFVAAINLGFEPREVDGYRAFYGEVFLRVGDENRPVYGPPHMPVEFLNQLLSAPITATVINVESAGLRTIATIDRGSDDGLRKDMPLVTADSESFYYEQHWIISVEPHTATVQIWNDVKVGAQLTTRISNVRRYS